MPDPIIVQPATASQPISASGQSFGIYEWRGSGPDYLHVHHSDDEAWHVLEGTLIFRFTDEQIEVPVGTTVFVPAGVAHAYFAKPEESRYLIILTPRLYTLIEELHKVPYAQHKEVMRKFDSEIVE
jgi:mannose-6-phosphate isomerase-like protein (cupin superfamily)